MTEAPELPDAELRDWNIVTDCGKQFVTGAIFNDSKGRFVDGHRVRTSSVKYLNTITGICRTQNTVYKLTNELPWNTRAPRPCVDLEADRRRKADYKIGAWLSPALSDPNVCKEIWLSAALSDPNVCKEMKSDIEAWFDSRDTAGHLAPRPACPHKRIDHNGECLDCDEPVWVDQTARQSGVPDGWVLVPREITPERADVLGIPAQLYAKIINGVA